ncbi:vesicular acetylcholine transporter-like [Liolophura sinensis]|uniref:vesicular acetylcholine transporter-like n=1 Tax=Liolophura sinensis TaxID=3198878 RepID=UPI0031594911
MRGYLTKEYITGLYDKFDEKIHDPKSQRRLVLLVVCIALLLDNMLYMVIVPIIPNILSPKGAQVTSKVDDLPKVNYSNCNYTATGTTFSYCNYTLVGNSSKRHYVVTKPKERRILDLPPPPIDMGANDAAIGVLFASKAILQLIVNPFTGTLIDRIGYDTPMMIGLIIIFLSTTTFALGESYAVLFAARSLQGLGSAFADTSGLAMIADRFTEEAERTKALGIALAFISFGCLVAPPFGGVLYEFAGKVVPFMLLALLSLLDCLLLFFLMKPMRAKRALMTQEERPQGTPIYRLLMDPYIAVTAGALAMSNVSLAFLEPTISIWMKETMDASAWEMGFVWLPAFIPHITGVYLTVKLSRNYPKYMWLLAAAGLAMEGLFCGIIPFAKAFGVLIAPIMGICFGIALVDTALLPTLGYLVDVRHVSVYGSVYAIADISYSLAYAFGPILAGSIVVSIGFLWLNMLIMISNVVYAPALYALRNMYLYKPFDDENDMLVDEPQSKHYQTYMRNDSVGEPPIDGKEDKIQLSMGDDPYNWPPSKRVRQQDEAGGRDGFFYQQYNVR